MSSRKITISIIGAGNVAHHLGHRLVECGYSISQVFSRRITKARRLAKPLGASAINDLGQLTPGANLYVIAVHDDVIEEVAKKMSLTIGDALVVHTSGSVPSKVLKNSFKNYGSFYPLQTFSIATQANFETIPLCIYSPQKRNRIFLKRIADAICPNVFEINDQQRAVLHLAATIVNNLSNQLYNMAFEIAASEGVDFNILKPLILETAKKVQKHDPKAVQSGPAIRGDDETMTKHLKFLDKHPDWSKIYQLLSKGIQEQRGKR